MRKKDKAFILYFSGFTFLNLFFIMSRNEYIILLIIIYLLITIAVLALFEKESD